MRKTDFALINRGKPTYSWLIVKKMFIRNYEKKLTHFKYEIKRFIILYILYI